MPASDDSDEALVRRYQAGEDEAGRVLFARLSTTLRPRARRRIAPGLRARVGESDLIQSAFAAVIDRLGEFRDGGPGSFRRWLSGIIDRKAVDEHRRQRGRGVRERAQETSLDAVSDLRSPSASGTSPSGAAMAGEARGSLWSAIERLTPDHRTVIRLIHDSKMSVGAAAVAMDRTYEATKKLYARALERLATLLGEGGAS